MEQTECRYPLRSRIRALSQNKIRVLTSEEITKRWEKDKEELSKLTTDDLIRMCESEGCKKAIPRLRIKTVEEINSEYETRMRNAAPTLRILSPTEITQSHKQLIWDELPPNRPIIMYEAVGASRRQTPK